MTLFARVVGVIIILTVGVGLGFEVAALISATPAAACYGC
jgi:hypothetical protein